MPNCGNRFPFMPATGAIPFEPALSSNSLCMGYQPRDRSGFPTS
jgi:hypothetical protein